MTVAQMQQQLKTPSFIAPTATDAERLAGWRAFDAGESLNPAWTSAKRGGWLQALRDCAWADTSAYLVERGVMQ